MGDVGQLHLCPLADLAFKKSTAQSSTDNNGFSRRAVDENLGPYYSSKSCTHTKKETNPWWRVDLGREYIVTGAWGIKSIFQKVKDHRTYVRSSNICREVTKMEVRTKQDPRRCMCTTNCSTAELQRKLVRREFDLPCPVRSPSVKIVVIPQFFACMY